MDGDYDRFLKLDCVYPRNDEAERQALNPQLRHCEECNDEAIHHDEYTANADD